ncbi:uncharacterized protein LOC132756195 isoform X2 [Ruditapes philippinarum]|nr:uncharacterized protein LOC132756195 isoform X2 [Ruditapes philippinarum]
MDTGSMSAERKVLQNVETRPDNIRIKHEAESDKITSDLNMTSSNDVSTDPKSNAKLTNYIDKENIKFEQMNNSVGESTGVLLTKALNTLVSSDYEMITPPRKSKSPKASAQKDKKVSLFRPYDLDNGKSSDKKPAIPAQSPMLLRSNYCSSGQEWLIEKRSKAEAIVNNVNFLGILQNASTIDTNSKTCLNRQEKSMSCTQMLTGNDQNNIRYLNSNSELISPEQKSVKLPPALLPLPHPVRSSTPKNSPCPSPNLGNLTPIPDLSVQRKELITVREERKCPPLVSAVQQTIYKNETSEMKPKFIPIQTTQSDIQSSSNELPVHVRYHASVGHRLPLKHSYKHQNIVNNPTLERARSPIKNEAESEIDMKDRYRSNSCPPISKQCSVQTHPQKGFLSNVTKTYIDAVKETWAAHHAVMTNTMPSNCDKPVLPSFSTFTNKLSSSQNNTMSLPVLNSQRGQLQDNSSSANSNIKHVRSRSEELRQSSDSSNAQPERPLSSEHVCGNNSEKLNCTDKLVLESCYRNADVRVPKPSQTGTTNPQATKAKTWHIPQVTHANTNEPEVVMNYGKPSQIGNAGENITGNGRAIVSSHQNRVPGIQRQWTCDSSQLVKNYDSVPGYYAPDSVKKVTSDLKKQFNPSLDIYRDPTHFTVPMLDPKLRMFMTPHAFNPNLMTPNSLGAGLINSLHIPRYSNMEGYQSHSREDLKPNVSAMGTGIRHAQSGSVGRTSSDGRVFTDRNASVQLKPSLVDPRRPLSTSALQNQPVIQTIKPEVKLPLTPLMMMMKSANQTTNVNANVEVINGGYGIKNPSFSAPKIQDFPEQCVNPDSSKFVCKFCNKEFALQRLLNRHLKCHSDSKRYLCTFCGKGFNDTFDLKRHTRIHTGVKPYKCPSCEKAFTQRCSLESHTKKVHGMDLPYGYKQRRTKVYVCEDCGHSTADPEDHFRHLQQNHPFCPALQRCHDKRQFKFRAEQEKQDMDNSDGNITPNADRHDNEPTERKYHREEIQNAFNRVDVDDKIELRNAVETLQSSIENEPVGNVDKKAEPGEHIRITETFKDQSRQTYPESLYYKNTNITNNSVEMCKSSSNNDNGQKVDQYSNVYVEPVADKTTVKRNTDSAINVIPESIKRVAASDPTCNSPKKKLKSINSPKKSKTNSSSPMKIRPPQFGVCENSNNMPKYDTENVISKKATDNFIKKRPLGSLTQNTLNQERNSRNMQLSNNDIQSVRRPLGNMGGKQW